MTTKRLGSLASILLLALGLAAFAGSAAAGNGNGNGDGSASGNSANTPPGQEKKDQATSTAGGSAAQNSGTQAGVKPTSATAKGNKPTSCTTGGGTGSSATCTSSGSNAATAQTAAKKDASKRYGSSTTAAQIANPRGAPAGTLVYGPATASRTRSGIAGDTTSWMSMP